MWVPPSTSCLLVLAEAMAALPAVPKEQLVAQVVLCDGLSQRRLFKLNEVVIVNIHTFSLIIPNFVKS
uniref:Putative secreted protein n=1 Tax=Ixodes ricinus TaxID=34613 RepID=A0A6B0TWJ0_IXORI